MIRVQDDKKLIARRWITANITGGAIGWSVAALVFGGTCGAGLLIVGFVVGFSIGWAQARFFEWYTYERKVWLWWLPVGSLTWGVGWLLFIGSSFLLHEWHYLIRAVLSFGLCGLTLSGLQALALRKQAEAPDAKAWMLANTIGWLLGGVVGILASRFVSETVDLGRGRFFIGPSQVVELAIIGFVSLFLIIFSTSIAVLRSAASRSGGSQRSDYYLAVQ